MSQLRTVASEGAFSRCISQSVMLYDRIFQSVISHMAFIAQNNLAANLSTH